MSSDGLEVGRITKVSTLPRMQPHSQAMDCINGKSAIVFFTEQVFFRHRRRAQTHLLEFALDIHPRRIFLEQECADSVRAARLSTAANTTGRSAMGPLVRKILLPLRMYMEHCLMAV